MTGKKRVDLENLRLRERDFDRMMRKALQAGVPAEDKAKGTKKAKKNAKRKGKR